MIAQVGACAALIAALGGCAARQWSDDEGSRIDSVMARDPDDPIAVARLRAIASNTLPPPSTVPVLLQSDREAPRIELKRRGPVRAPVAKPRPPRPPPEVPPAASPPQ